MRTRCNNKKTPNYNCYGGRGIKVCKRWNKFGNFYEDMKTGFQENLTLDRINNNKGYSMNNCRWTGRKQQAINRRNTRLLGFNGQKLTLTDWAVKLGKKRSTLAQRFYVLKWAVEKTLTFNPNHHS
jgi:hypothetical protein